MKQSHDVGGEPDVQAYTKRRRRSSGSLIHLLTARSSAGEEYGPPKSEEGLAM